MLTDPKSPIRRGAAAFGVAVGAAGALLPTAAPAGAAGTLGAAGADDPGCTKNDGQVVEQVDIARDSGPLTGHMGLLTLWYSPSTECVWSTTQIDLDLTDHGPIMAKLFKENNGARVGWDTPIFPHKAATDAWYVGRDTEFTGYGRIDYAMHYMDAWTGTYVLQGADLVASPGR
jgi:hypothetical protein